MGEANATTASSILQTVEAIHESFSNYTTINPLLNLTGVASANTQLKLYDILIPTIGGLIIVTNLIVVLSSGLLIKKGVNPRTTYLFLGNVAMADLVTGIAVLFGQFYPKSSRTPFVCSFQIGLIVSSTLASIYSVGLIAIDRFLYIIHGLKYHRWVYPTRARLCITFTWGIGIILGFLPATGLLSGGIEGGKMCWFISVAPPGLVLLITIVGLLPVLLVVVLYGIILYHAIKKVIQLRRADKNREQQTGSREGDLRIFRGGNSVRDETPRQKEKTKPSKIKAVKVVVLTCGSFVITWMPYFIASSIYLTCDQTTGGCKGLKVAIASPLAILGFLNSLLNPLIYAWWHNGFRTFMRKILCKGRSANRELSTSTTKSGSSARKTQSSRSKSDGNQSDANQSDTNLHTVDLRDA